MHTMRIASCYVGYTVKTCFNPYMPHASLLKTICVFEISKKIHFFLIFSINQLNHDKIYTDCATCTCSSDGV